MRHFLVFSVLQVNTMQWVLTQSPDYINTKRYTEWLIIRGQTNLWQKLTYCNTRRNATPFVCSKLTLAQLKTIGNYCKKLFGFTKLHGRLQFLLPYIKKGKSIIQLISTSNCYINFLSRTWHFKADWAHVHPFQFLWLIRDPQYVAVMTVHRVRRTWTTKCQLQEMIWVSATILLFTIIIKS